MRRMGCTRRAVRVGKWRIGSAQQRDADSGLKGLSVPEPPQQCIITAPLLTDGFPGTVPTTASDHDDADHPTTVNDASPLRGIAAEVAALIVKGEATMRLVDEDCVGGTYWVLNKEGDRIAVFKPTDEEAGAAANPKGLTEPGQVQKAGCSAGGGAAREVLSYVLDEGFAGVPETDYVEVPPALLGRHGDDDRVAVRGSLQRFVMNEGASWDRTPLRHTTSAVHRIGILDLRILNCDRHGGNMLTLSGGGLVPIDHGYSLPSSLADLDFEWHLWPQAKEPFTAEELAYVDALNPEADAQRARANGIESRAADLLRAAGIALKAGCRNGMTLRQLADVWRCEGVGERSALCIERLVDAAEVDGSIDWDRFTALASAKLHPPSQ